MVDITITAASVVPGSDAVKTSGIALSTITAGQVVYRDPTTLKFAPADTDSATAAIRDVFGIALNGAAANQPVSVQTSGTLTAGGTLLPGMTYVLSGTAGGFAPVADIANGDYTVVIGVATTAAILKLGILKSGVVAAVT
tara:strand:- start:1657 stop:2076 length:420 start_codon:yes stop_codon:yes gene_type:complete